MKSPSGLVGRRGLLKENRYPKILTSISLDELINLINYSKFNDLDGLSLITLRART